MGGLGAASSSATTSGGGAGGGASTASGATSSAGGLAMPIIAGAGLGFTAIEMMNNSKANKKQLQNIRKQQLYNQQKKKNILEEQLATRRARIGGMGISSSGSVTAANNKLIDDIYQDIAEDDEAYNDDYSEVSNNYQTKLRKNLLDAGLGLTGKILK